MAVRVTIKTNLGMTISLVEKIPETLQAAIPQILNRAGTEMARDAADMIAAKLNLPSEYIWGALMIRNATEVLTSFEVSSRDERFNYVRWITQRDERVCPICGPRDNHLFTVMETRYNFPAHPNCRCQLEPVSMGIELVMTADKVLPPAVAQVSAELLKVFEGTWHI